MSIWELLGWKRGGEAGSDDATAETVRAVAAKLEHLDPTHARYVAAFAYILGRVAQVDLDISKEESAAMERAVQSLGRLTEPEAVVVVEIAKAHNRLFGSTDSYIVTRDFAAATTRDQRMALLECLFAVSAADSDVSGAEENEIHKIALELKLEREDFLEARLRYREYIAVLKSASAPPPGPRPAS